MAEAATSKAISKITEQAIFLYGVDEQVRELVTELGRMRSFLKDVDSRRQSEERVRNWAREIRDLVQDAESVVDKFATEVIIQKRNGEDDTPCFCTILTRVVKEVIIRYKIGWDIRKINKRIKSLTESLITYGIHGINEGETSNITEVLLQSGAIAVESWGGTGGDNWSYRPRGLVKQIIVNHGNIIDSIMFNSMQENGVMESSPTFGGNGGHIRTEINVHCPSEYLTGISGTFGFYGSYLVIKSIKFHTNLRHHGPLGPVDLKADTSFSFVMQGGVVIGFHGSSGLFLDAIGLYVVPVRISLLSQPTWEFE